MAVFPIQDVTGKLDKTLVESLTEYLSAALATGGSFSIQAPTDMKRLLDDKASESYHECFDEKCQIELGRELAANKMISAKIIQLGDACTVTAALYDLRTQATDISATADRGCSPRDLKRSLDQVAAQIRAWQTKGSRVREEFREGKIGEREKQLDLEGGQETIIAFRSQPEGAVVIVDGSLVCEQTPCSRKFPAGTHEVSMQKKRYRGRTEQVVFARGAEFDWELEPTFGMLTVSSQPSGQDVLVNGTVVGKTPLERHPLDPGNYEVLVSSPCFYDKGERIQILARKERSVDVELKPKVGGVQVDAKDPAGNDVEAELLLDGDPLGTSPGRFPVSVCARKLLARSSCGVAEVELEVEEGEWRKLELTLQPEKKAVSSQQGGQTPSTASASAEPGASVRIAPTVGYGTLQGLVGKKWSEEDQGYDDAQISTQGPTVGARIDLLLSEMLGVTAHYDYGFLTHIGIAYLGMNMTSSDLLGNYDSAALDVLPGIDIGLGLALIHGGKDDFDDGAKLEDDYLELGMAMSVGLYLDFVIADLVFLGVAGDFGYLLMFNSTDSSASSFTYLLSGTFRAGVRF
ncbi:MAG: PEGA domain-containing protein [Deltaproteobacteria bacterium]|nr:PEGA domain-containing protein [Deltaproteobacteria bacterium]